jgi:glutaredoxin 3
MTKVIIYSSTICTKCMMAKKYLENKGIAYEVRDITNPEYRKELIDKHIMTLPVIVAPHLANGTVVGFDKDKIDALIATL